MHKRVLIADDSKLMRRILARIPLVCRSCRCRRSKERREAVSSLPNQTDIDHGHSHASALDGLQALKVIKALDPNARVVSVSSIGQQDVIMEAIQPGLKIFSSNPSAAARC